MDLKSTKKIDIDFYNQKYILINAKQNDKNSRFLEVTCYNRGELFPLNPNNHSAFVRYRKADEYGVLNKCEMNYDGTIVVELTEQMLAVAGMCYTDLIIIDNGFAEVDYDTGEITGIKDSAILSTMTFCVDVVETAIENSQFESTPEFDKLNKLLTDATAEYDEVINAAKSWSKESESWTKTAKSWAIGATGTRDNEDNDNSKYYAQQASASSDSASDKAKAAADSAGEAKDYLDRVETIVDGLENTFIPMGSVTFAELATVSKATGYVYNMKENFVTDDTFREGAGVSYNAGTNVYFTKENLWDCLGGATPLVATVDEVKAELGI